MRINGSELMSTFNFTEKYSRFNREESRRETWDESVDRMFDMHLRKYSDKLTTPALEEFELVRQAVKDKKLLGSQRALQFGGKGVEKHNMRIYNCAVSYADRPRFFAECFYMLLCGCGTGFSVQKHHVAQLPGLISITSFADESEAYVVEDSIEGWSDALDALINYFLGLREKFPEFDFSLIRERGAPLSVGGTAPGPEPLKKALEKIQTVFETCILLGRKRLRPIDVYDIVMHAADAVLSGGVRRSATIALFSPDDREMAFAKTGNWYVENPQRARSNNSAVLLRDEDNLEDFKTLMRAVREFGEPGFIFVSSREHIYNPCVEIGMCPVLIRDKDGEIVQEYTLELLDFDKRAEQEAAGYSFESGWQCCNLSEQNAAIWKTREDALLSAKYAAILGTLQAGYYEPGYLTEASKHIIERESLLGVSMTGMMDNPKFAFDPTLQSDMAEVVRETNKIWAPLLGLRTFARGTCVKPAGNSTILLSILFLYASGVNPHKTNTRMYRLVQVPKDSPVGQYFQKHNPHMVEESVWSANKTDNVIKFPITIKPGALSVNDMSAVKFLEYVKLTQENWVTKGTNRPMSCEGLTHNVSNTCEVNPDEWGEVGRYIYNNRHSFSGISLLGKSGDFMYRQAPMQRVYFEDELIERFGAANVGAAKHMRRHINNRYGSIYNVMMALKMVLQGYSSEEAVKGSAIHKELMWDTYKRIRSTIHLEEADDILLLLSSVFQEEEWNALVSDMVKVDYTGLIEEKDITKPTDSVACAGGVCDVDFTIPKDN